MPSRDRVEVVADCHAALGEGPVWDVRSARVVWVDILGRKIHLTDPQTGDTEDIDVPLHVGAVVPNAAGGFVAALQDGFWLVGSGAPRLITRIREAGPAIRFNDGKCDPGGRFWAGTMAYDESRAAASLYRLDTDGQATRVLDEVTISNGLAWSADGNTMFYIDTPTQTIDAFSFDPSTGAIADRRPVIAIPPAAGAPDGMAIDAEGGLWVALWGGGALHRYLDGRLDRVVPMPVSRPTSCAFGGSDFDELFVTSASTGLTIEARRAEPLAGALFRVRPGIAGRPPAIFSDVEATR